MHKQFLNDRSKMKKWGVELDAKLMTLTGKKLHPPKLMVPAGAQCTLRSFSDFNNKSYRMEHLEPLIAHGDTEDDFDGETSCAEWAFVYHHTDADIVN